MEKPRRAIHTDDLPERFCFRVSGWYAAVSLRGGWLACMDNLSSFRSSIPLGGSSAMRIARVLSSSDRSQLNVCCYVSDLISVSHGILAYCVFWGRAVPANPYPCQLRKV